MSGDGNVLRTEMSGSLRFAQGDGVGYASIDDSGAQYGRIYSCKLR